MGNDPLYLNQMLNNSDNCLKTCQVRSRIVHTQNGHENMARVRSVRAFIKKIQKATSKRHLVDMQVLKLAKTLVNLTME